MPWKPCARTCFARLNRSALSAIAGKQRTEPTVV